VSEKENDVSERKRNVLARAAKNEGNDVSESARERKSSVDGTNDLCFIEFGDCELKIAAPH
jgi:hypothetical protein